MFVKYEHINGRKLIDVRTRTEFIKMNMTKYNIPIINEKEHQRIKSFYPLALFIILAGIIRKREEIKRELLKISNNGIDEVVIACSRGRLRSPIIYIYAKLIGIKCKVLLGGLKKRYSEKETFS